ncbi:MAG: hypothetical protein WCC87_02245 [Candidatus Korobacteraceae bacterium]
MFFRVRRFCLILLLLLLSTLVYADTAAFDLPGPRIEVRVSRSGKELSIAQVPNLQEGDRLWVHPDFPETQSAHYLLIVAFLRGSTNPPPENWFTKIETWNKHVREEGTMVTVPKGAEQVLLFLAPETGGDFGTLRTAVRGKPGAFVRAAADLNEASLDRSRLEAYLSAVKQAADNDPDKLKDTSALLARSLNIKLDNDCFKKPVDEQAACLVQKSDQLVLDDAHSQSMVNQLASGAGADLVGQISATPMAGGGFYSAYVGAIVDVVRLTTTWHTAEYQYIPALAVPHEDQLNLKMNTPPSFRNPKSVLVIGLPAVEAPKLPPLKPVDPKGVYCLSNSTLVLPAEGAPLVFSTKLAYGLDLHVWSKSGKSMDLPAKADAARGGFVVDTASVKGDDFSSEASGTLRGQWGFDAFEGPTFALRVAYSAKWTVVSADQSALVVGRDDTLHLQSDAAACVQDVTVEDQQGKKLKTSWKLVNPGEVQIEMPLKDVTPGALKLEVKQFGLAKPDDVALHSYSEAAKLDELVIDAGDQQAVLKGTRLDEVASVEAGGVHFTTGALTRAGDEDDLSLQADKSSQPELRHGEKITAQVKLKDGRVLDLAGTVRAPRPKVTLLSKVIQPNATAASSPIQLDGQDELPQNATLSFSLKAQAPAAFSHDETIEVATADDSVHVLLSVADGTLALQDAQTVVAVLDPLKDLGSSAFGPLRFRPIAANGEKGDWQPLVNLVRLPEVKQILCPSNPDDPCSLSGTALYLLDSVSSDPQFEQSTPVPDGFAGSSLSVPRPDNGALYVKLRDNPSAINKLTLTPVTETSEQAQQ